MLSIDNENFCCPICYEVYQGKIFQCKNGHLVCEKCVGGSSICAQCRCSMSPHIRNRALENILTENRNLFIKSKRKEKPKRETYFAVKCRHCLNDPIKGARYSCVFCVDSEFCGTCWKSLQDNGSNCTNSEILECAQTHVFALLETVLQNNDYAVISRGGPKLELFRRGLCNII